MSTLCPLACRRILACIDRRLLCLVTPYLDHIALDLQRGTNTLAVYCVMLVRVTINAVSVVSSASSLLRPLFILSEQN